MAIFESPNYSIDNLNEIYDSKINLRDKLILIFKYVDANDSNKIIENVLNNYRQISMGIIKFVTTYYPYISSKATIKHILKCGKSMCDLIDCILMSYKIKLCNNPEIKSIICGDECKCQKRTIWKYLYNELISLIENDNTQFLNDNIYKGLEELVDKTDALNDQLYILLNNLSNNHKMTKQIILFINNAKLYSTKYGSILIKLYNNSSIEHNDNYINEHNNKILIKTIHKYYKMQKNITKISNNIYITDHIGARNVAIIREKNINCIVTVTKKAIFKISNIHYTQIMIDDTNTVDFINKTISAVDEVIEHIKQNKIVLIHCNKGISRSVSFALLILIKQGIKYEKALEYLKQKRKHINPNPEFLNQIEEYAKKNIFFNV